MIRKENKFRFLHTYTMKYDTQAINKRNVQKISIFWTTTHWLRDMTI